MSDNEKVAMVQVTGARGFGPLPCPYCGEEDASVVLDLTDMMGEKALCCTSCQTSFSVAHVEKLIRRWTPVLNWIQQAPLHPQRQ